MRKGEWYLVSDAKGVLCLTRIDRVDHAEGDMDYTMHARNHAWQAMRIDKYPIYEVLASIAEATRKGTETTSIKARDARNLLKFLQRKLP